MAAAQAQHEVGELRRSCRATASKSLRDPPGRGPHARSHERAAAEVNVPIDQLKETAEINPEWTG